MNLQVSHFSWAYLDDSSGLGWAWLSSSGPSWWVSCPGLAYDRLICDAWVTGPLCTPVSCPPAGWPGCLRGSQRGAPVRECFPSLFLSLSLLFHWLKQVTYSNPDSVQDGTTHEHESGRHARVGAIPPAVCHSGAYVCIRACVCPCY